MKIRIIDSIKGFVKLDTAEIARKKGRVRIQPPLLWTPPEDMEQDSVQVPWLPPPAGHDPQGRNRR